MGLLRGADSAYPQPTYYKGFAIWGMYVGGDTPHVWTPEEVAATADEGVWGILPIVVPQQGVEWWAKAEEHLAELVAQAKSWGLPARSPLCLDLEEDQAAAIGTEWLPVGRRWALACYRAELVPWLYAPRSTLLQDDKSVRWMSGNPGDATWPVSLAPGVDAWQYATSADNGAIDLDAFPSSRTYLDPRSAVTAGAGGGTPPKPPPASPVTESGEDAYMTELSDRIDTLTAVVTSLNVRVAALEALEKTDKPDPTPAAGAAPTS